MQAPNLKIWKLAFEFIGGTPGDSVIAAEGIAVGDDEDSSNHRKT